MSTGLFDLGGAYSPAQYLKVVFGCLMLERAVNYVMIFAVLTDGKAATLIYVTSALILGSVKAVVTSRRIRDIRGTQVHHWPFVIGTLLLTSLPLMLVINLLVSGQSFGVTYAAASLAASLGIMFWPGKISTMHQVL